MICLCTHGHPACALPSVSRLRLQKYGFFQYNPRNNPSPTNPKNASCYQSAACVNDNSYQNSEGHYLLKTPIRLPKDIRFIHIIIFFISTQSLQSVLLYYITTISIFSSNPFLSHFFFVSLRSDSTICVEFQQNT